ncbi:MAG: hypothetical protein ACREHG_09285 [Candidatus Saccharimonadales bacterium]
MSPFIALHATRRACRHSILHLGLLRSQPNRGQPYGIYVYRQDDSIDHQVWLKTFEAIHCRWAGQPPQDIWMVAYIGPMCEDQYVTNGMVLLQDCPQVTLVTGNKW